MGYGTAVSIIAVGDTVSSASRIESLPMPYLGAGDPVFRSAPPRHEIEIRGRVERLVVRTFTGARDLGCAGA
jgi:hypothetical protein